MKHFGVLLAGFRVSAGLSLVELASYVGTSKSTLSRLENDAVSRPFRGVQRKLVLDLAEIVCASGREVERYLEAAGIDPATLTEAEELQLGLDLRLPPGMADGGSMLVYWQEVHERLLRRIEGWQQETGAARLSLALEHKARFHREALQDLHRRLDRVGGMGISGDEAEKVGELPVIPVLRDGRFWTLHLVRMGYGAS